MPGHPLGQLMRASPRLAKRFGARISPSQYPAHAEPAYRAFTVMRCYTLDRAPQSKSGTDAAALNSP
jgi:hypothetical protein